MFHVLASFQQDPLPLRDWINIGILVGIPIIAILVAFILNRFQKAPAEQDEPFFPIHKTDVLVAVALAVCFIVLFALSLFGDHKTSGESIIASQGIMTLLMLPALVTVYSHSAVSVFRPNKVAWFVGGLLSVYAVTYLANEYGFFEMIHEMFDAPLEQDVVHALQNGGLCDKLLFVFSTVVVAPILEETLFRGYFYPILRKYTNVPFALLCVSLFFGAVHLSLVHFLILSFVGFVLNIAYEKTHSLRLSIAMHATYNALSVAALYVFTLFLGTNDCIS